MSETVRPRGCSASRSHARIARLRVRIGGSTLRYSTMRRRTSGTQDHCSFLPVSVKAELTKCAQTLHSGNHGHAHLCRRLHLMAAGRANRISWGSDRMIVLGVLAFAVLIL